MQGLPQQPTMPEPAPERHPTKGRCSICGQKLPRLWRWEIGQWLPERWCCDECCSSATGREEARHRAAILARREAVAQPGSGGRLMPDRMLREGLIASRRWASLKLHLQTFCAADLGRRRLRDVSRQPCPDSQPLLSAGAGARKGGRPATLARGTRARRAGTLPLAPRRPIPDAGEIRASGATETPTGTIPTSRDRRRDAGRIGTSGAALHGRRPARETTIRSERREFFGAENAEEKRREIPIAPRRRAGIFRYRDKQRRRRVHARRGASVA